MKRIPVAAAQRIADQYDYDQVVIIARKIDQPGKRGAEHVITYGRDKVHCAVAAAIGDFIKHQIMGWPQARHPLIPQPKP